MYRVRGTNQFVSSGLKDQYETDAIHVDVNIVDGVELDIEAFKKWRNGEYANAEFILEDGKYICGVEVEKMSKSKFNTVNPDDLVEQIWRRYLPNVRNVFRSGRAKQALGYKRH